MASRVISIVGTPTGGGIADYAHFQAHAFAAKGIDVTLYCGTDQVVSGPVNYRRREIMPEVGTASLLPGPARKLFTVARIVKGMHSVAQALAAEPPHAVLTQFSEYLAPLWAPRLRRLKTEGFSFHTVLHDPKRTAQVGPASWHRRSVAEAFSLYDTIFVHGTERGDAPLQARLVTVPLGVYEMPKPNRPREVVRADLGVPADALLLVQFGFLRDYKNIDLVIRALPKVPNVHLLVAGAEHGGSRPAAFYRALAREAGVAERCHFAIGFHDSATVSSYLTASDVVCLAYSRRFVSASGVLATAAHHRLHVLISCGVPQMRAVVEEYGIGRWVEPDSVDAIADGLAKLLVGPPTPEWERYEREQSWQKNAEIILDRIAEAAQAKDNR